MFPFTLNQLRVFKVIATEQSFTKAASRLYFSQPSLSRQIVSLEKKLGIRLLYWQANTLILTVNGKLLLRYANRILVLCEESCRILTNNRKNGQKTRGVRIGFDQVYGIYLCPTILTLFTKQDFYLRLTVVLNLKRHIMQQVLSQELDMALISDESSGFLNKRIAIRMEPYLNSPFYLTLSNSQFLAKYTTNLFLERKLLNFAFITLRKPNIISTPIPQVLQISQLDPSQFKMTIQLNSIVDLKIAVKLGLGITFLPGLTLNTEITLKWVKIMKIPGSKIGKKLLLFHTLRFTEKATFAIFHNKLLHFKKS
jgi:DNA-binding transcriptional LysR family regulator